MQLPALHQGVLQRRYKRFLADIDTDQGLITAHCPNTGAMTGCAEPGSEVWYSMSDNPKRKYAATWELVKTPEGLCSVNTGRANHLVGEALRAEIIEPLCGYSTIRPEAPIPEGNGRFDFLLEDATLGSAYVEVKSVTLHIGGGSGAFPDAVSERALKHLNALQKRAHAGDRAVLIFCAQHCGLASVQAAAHIDARYAEALSAVIHGGVEVLAYGCSTDLQTFGIDKLLPFKST